MSQADQPSGNVTRLPASRPPSGEPPSVPHNPSPPRPATTILDWFWYIAVGALFPTFIYTNYLYQNDPQNLLRDCFPIFSHCGLLAILVAVRVSSSISYYDTIPLGLLFFGAVVSVLGEISDSPDNKAILVRAGAALIGIGAGFYLGVSMGQRKLIDDKSPK